MATDVRAAELLPPLDWDDDARRFYEVVDGTVVENPPMGARESFLAGLLQNAMGPFAAANRLGCVVPETLFLLDLSRGLKRRPDLAFVSKDRWPLNRPVPRIEGWDVVPDLAVEVVSQSNSADTIAVKIQEYFEAGVRAVWVVYPVINKIYVYGSPTQARILQVGDVLEDGALLPGVRIALSGLFGEGSEDEAD